MSALSRLTVKALNLGKSIICLDEVILGEDPRKVANFFIPVFIRSDGLSLTLNQILAFDKPFKSWKNKDEWPLGETKYFFIVEIRTSHDLNLIRLTLSEIDVVSNSNSNVEPTTRKISNRQRLFDVDIDEPKKRNQSKLPLSENLPGAFVLMESVSNLCQNYPKHILRFVRRNQLVFQIRNLIKRHLEGFSSTLSTCLGLVDWRHDLRIFGLESSTQFSIEHHLEGHVDHKSRLDFLLGDNWDVCPVVLSDGFRVVVTFRLFVNVDGMLHCFAHSFLSSKRFEEKRYREICMQEMKEIDQKRRSNLEEVPMSPDLLSAQPQQRCMTVSPEWDSFDEKRKESFHTNELEESEVFESLNVSFGEDVLLRKYRKNPDFVVQHSINKSEVMPRTSWPTPPQMPQLTLKEMRISDENSELNSQKPLLSSSPKTLSPNYMKKDCKYRKNPDFVVQHSINKSEVILRTNLPDTPQVPQLTLKEIQISDENTELNSQKPLLSSSPKSPSPDDKEIDNENHANNSSLGIQKEHINDQNENPNSFVDL